MAIALFWIAAACCAVAEAALLRSAVRTFRRMRAAPAGSVAGGPRRAAGEVIWALVPAVALAFVLMATLRAVRTGSASTGTPPAATAPVTS